MSLPHGGSEPSQAEQNPLTGALLKADTASLAINAEKDGKLRIRCSSWMETLVVQLDQEVILRWVDGQLHVYKVPRP